MRPGREDPAHLGVDPLEIGLAGRPVGELEVVVEAVLDRRPDRDLGRRVEVLHGLGEHVRGRVAQHAQRILVADAQDPQARAVVQRQAQVAQLAVDLDGGRRRGELRADRARRVEARRAVGKARATRRPGESPASRKSTVGGPRTPLVACGEHAYDR